MLIFRCSLLYNVLVVFVTARSGIGTALYLAGQTGATMTLNALYVYTAELFPTRARHRLLAACSTVGRLGAIMSPLTPLLVCYLIYIPTH